MSRKNTRPLCPHCHKPINLKPKEYREIREMLRLTQREIAAKLGVKASHVAYLEAGRRMAVPPANAEEDKPSEDGPP